MLQTNQLTSYIAPGAPATRRPVTGAMPFLRPEIGFTPRWYHQALGIRFGEAWHTDPRYRRDSRLKMYAELERRFPGTAIGRLDEDAVDVLTGTFGTTVIAAIYGIPIRFDDEQWPVSGHHYLSEEAIEQLTPPDLDQNPFFQSLLEQVDRITEMEGRAIGFINWQGVLNNAQRLRGQELFPDLYLAPERTRHLLACVCTTMIDAARRLQQKQRHPASDTLPFFTVSNCLVNLVDAGLYREFLLPFDQKIAEAFGLTGIHNCAWNATPYLESYAWVPGVGYIDMGMDSDLSLARRLFPHSRRAIMYPPQDVATKPVARIRSDLERIARDYGPCDLVAADIEAGTPDEKILALIDLCHQLSEEFSGT